MNDKTKTRPGPLEQALIECQAESSLQDAYRVEWRVLVSVMAMADRFLSKAFAEQSKRIAAIENKGVRYRGVYQRANAYDQGDIVTAAGGLWIAIRSTDAKPGDGDSWQLAVKSK